MHAWLTLLLLAEEKQVAKPQQPSFIEAFMMPMVLIGVLWYFLLFRPQKRDQGRREELLNAIKKNDRVQTIGGIIGTVASVSDDKKEVTVRVDDNTKIRFVRSAIQTVLKDDAADASKSADAASAAK